MQVIIIFIGALIIGLIVKISVNISNIFDSNMRKNISAAKGNRYKVKEKNFLNFFKVYAEKIKLSNKNFAKKVESATSLVNQAGYFDENAPYLFLFFQYLFPVIVFLLVFIIRSDFAIAILATFLLMLIPKLVLNGKVASRRKQFQKCAYKIYKYMASQVSSGIKPLDAMKSVYQVIEDKELSYVLAAFTATFSLTQSFKESAKQLTKRFNGSDVEALVMVFEQGVKTGDNLLMLERQEKIMFDAYMNVLQEETEKAKFFAFLVAGIYGLVVVAMISVPLIAEMITGFGDMFVS